MEPKSPEPFVAVARVARPQGRRGEVVAEILTDFPSRLEELREVFLEEPGRTPRPVTLEDAWPHRGRMVLKFSRVNSIEDAERLRGRHIFVRQGDRTTLPPDRYYIEDLRGCRVVRERDGAQKEIGTVTEVEATGGVDLLHVARANGGGELLIPLAEAICTRIDPAARMIVIDPPEGLLDLNL